MPGGSETRNAPEAGRVAASLAPFKSNDVRGMSLDRLHALHDSEDVKQRVALFANPHGENVRKITNELKRRGLSADDIQAGKQRVASRVAAKPAQGLFGRIGEAVGGLAGRIRNTIGGLHRRASDALNSIVKKINERPAQAPPTPRGVEDWRRRARINVPDTSRKPVTYRAV